MALPSSGSLSIKKTSGNDRSIAQEVDGNIDDVKSLSLLGETVGFFEITASISMLQFLGYPPNITIVEPINPQYTGVGSLDIEGVFTVSSNNNFDSIYIYYSLERKVGSTYSDFTTGNKNIVISNGSDTINLLVIDISKPLPENIGTYRLGLKFNQLNSYDYSNDFEIEDGTGGEGEGEIS